MAVRLVWDAERDERLRALRGAGMTWDGIAAMLGLGRNTVLERGRRIGARRPTPVRRAEPEDPGRPPRPPGHPETWGLLTRGTLLEGTPYPFPVFL